MQWIPNNWSWILLNVSAIVIPWVRCTLIDDQPCSRFCQKTVWHAAMFTWKKHETPKHSIYVYQHLPPILSLCRYTRTIHRVFGVLCGPWMTRVHVGRPRINDRRTQGVRHRQLFQVLGKVAGRRYGIPRMMSPQETLRNCRFWKKKST